MSTFSENKNEEHKIITFMSTFSENKNEEHKNHYINDEILWK